MSRFYRAGQHAALQHMKLSGERVTVTDKQTYQHNPEPGIFTSDAIGVTGSVGNTWDKHDHRFQVANRSPADLTSSMTGGDG
jgi:hypothetical protein